MREREANQVRTVDAGGTLTQLIIGGSRLLRVPCSMDSNGQGTARQKKLLGQYIIRGVGV